MAKKKQKSTGAAKRKALFTKKSPISSEPKNPFGNPYGKFQARKEVKQDTPDIGAMAAKMGDAMYRMKH